MASISCVYCGASHATAGEVRECWQRNQGNEVAGDTTQDGAGGLMDVGLLHEPQSGTPSSRPSAPRARTVAAATVPTAAVVLQGRGPLVLGRNVLVAPGQAVPHEWADAPRVVVARTEACVAELQQLASQRTGAVLEVSASVEPEALQPPTCTLPLHEVGPRFEFLDDTLRHLLTANAVDARAAAPSPTPTQGDLRLADGTWVWVDGGPVRFTPPVAGVPVVHRVALEHGGRHAPLGNESSAALAPDQLAAVTHTGGAARIIAPAGSGKTRVLTERARHLITQWRLPTSAVCLVAFNKRAQEEIVARTRDLPGLQVRTLNAIALAIVNGSAPFARRSEKVATVDEPEVRRLIGKLVTFPRKRNADPVATWIEALSAARLGLRAPADVEAFYDGDVDGFTEVFPTYRARLAKAGQVDYDEQIVRAIELLLTDPTVRAAAQRACRVLLVDEFQDLTPAHLLLVRLLAGPDGAVFGVGDDDQTIYGYNGADPGWLIDFAALFPGAGEHPLEVNYRCAAGIVRAADTLLRHNKRRVAKTIRAAAAAVADGHDGFMVAGGQRDSVGTTVQAIRTAIDAGLAPGEVAVLTRVNSLLAPVQVALQQVGIPVVGGVGTEFMERTAVRAALAWLRLSTAKGAFSPSDVAEALRRPSRSMSPRIADWVGEQTSLDALKRLAARITTEKDANTVLDFAADIEVLQTKANRNVPTAQLFAVLRDQMGLAKSIAILDLHRQGMNRAAQNDDLVALAQLAELQPDPRAFEGWLRSALSTRASGGQGVTLATVHRVKGLEWPFVVVHHADAEQFPHRLATDVEEERRLFHVAITRAARDVLVVPSPEPSPFIIDCSTEPSARTMVVARSGKPAPPATKQPAKTTSADLSPDELRRFEALRDWRRQAAAGKPAYTVLADAALQAIARSRPSSLDELARVKGIGPAKLELYGDSVLRVLADL
jgi:DNA helicase II / ATP-dependent DNA helicase PcrA